MTERTYKKDLEVIDLVNQILWMELKKNFSNVIFLLTLLLTVSVVP